MLADAGPQRALYGPGAVRNGPGCRRQTRQAETAARSRRRSSPRWASAMRAEICRDGKGRPEPDSELRDTENIPLPPGTALPLPMKFGPDMPNDELVAAMRPTIDAYIAAEVLPHVPDAWVDYAKTKVGTKFRSTGISTSTSHRARWPRSRRTLRRWKARSLDCSRGLWCERAGPLRNTLADEAAEVLCFVQRRGIAREYGRFRANPVC